MCRHTHECSGLARREQNRFGRLPVEYDERPGVTLEERDLHVEILPHRIELWFLPTAWS